MNRWLKKLLKILKFIGIALIILILILAGFIWWNSRDKVDAVYIRHVDFSSARFDLDRSFTHDEQEIAELDFENLKEPYFMSNYHWLKEGKKVALVFRTFSEGLIMTLDDEVFSQVTIVLPNIQEGSFKIDGNQVRAMYTDGGSAWPSGQCGAFLESGTVTISKVRSSKFTARIDFETECHRKILNNHSQISFHREEVFSELSFKEARPWHGKKGAHIYRETYR